MRTLVLLLAFLVLGWGYWVLSGGSDFQPETRAQAARSEAPAESVLQAASPTADDRPGGPEVASAPAPAQAEPAAPVEPAPAREQPILEEVTAVQPTVAEEPPAPPAEEEPASARAPLSAAEALAAIGSDLTTPPQEQRLEVASANVGASQRRVTADRVNVRQGPGVDFGVLDQVDAGDVTEVLEQDGGWVRVRTPGGTVGWMSARFLAVQDG